MQYCPDCGSQRPSLANFCPRCGAAVPRRVYETGSLARLSGRLAETGSLAATATLLWMECGSCSGESMAILGAEGPGKEGDNLLDFLDHNRVQLLWHPSLSSESPREAEGIIERVLAGEQHLTFLCVEGSIINGPDGTGMFDTLAGKPKRDIVGALCDKADYVFAMGTCSSFGGIPASPPNPTESSGLQFTNGQPGGLLPTEWRSRAGLPVVNLAGCPVDATTMINTLGWVLRGLPIELDSSNRPFTVTPCLSTVTEKRCGTADKVGYACYGCIGSRFPAARPLFRLTERPEKARPADPSRKKMAVSVVCAAASEVTV